MRPLLLKGLVVAFCCSVAAAQPVLGRGEADPRGPPGGPEYSGPPTRRNRVVVADMSFDVQ